MACTVLWSSGSTLMRRTSPCTRIMGGRPAERCRSDALFLTLKASRVVMSTTDLPLECHLNAVPLEGNLMEVAGWFGTLRKIMTTIASKLQSVRAQITDACQKCGRQP